VQATSRISPSTRRLSEVARHLILPAGIVSTGWPSVAAKCAEFGDTFDAWQDGLGRAILGKRADGKYAATVGGITLSIPRQVAKTFIVGRIIFALCVLFPGLKVLWTAHHSATLTSTFQSLSGFARRKRVAPYVGDPTNGGSGIKRGSGKEAILFRNGSSIRFGARDQGWGRGFEEIDIEVFDEAQILNPKALEDMVAATNQSRHAHGALLFYMGTPPRPTDPGETFSERRQDALTIKAGAPDFGEPAIGGNALFVECSADANVGQKGGPSLDDMSQVRKANPSFPHRTPLESVQRLRANLKSDEAWRREGLGVWDPGAGDKATIKPAQWRPLGEGILIPTDGRVAVGVKFSLDGKSVALCAARKTHVEVLAQRPMADGLGWLVDYLVANWRSFAGIAIDGKAGRDMLAQDLRDKGVADSALMLPTTDQVIAAHTAILAAVNDKTLTHANQPGLNASVASSTQRKIGPAGGWGWEPIGEGDSVPLESATFALWAVTTSKFDNFVAQAPRRLY